MNFPGYKIVIEPQNDRQNVLTGEVDSTLFIMLAAAGITWCGQFCDWISQ